MSAPLLTPRQMQVAKLIASGLTANEIAGQLGISPNTVGVHQLAIWARTGCQGPVQLAHWAIHHGLVKAVPPKGAKLP